MHIPNNWKSFSQIHMMTKKILPKKPIKQHLSKFKKTGNVVKNLNRLKQYYAITHFIVKDE